MLRTYISVELRHLVRADARSCCGYCHTPEMFLGMPLDIEHLVPEALGGTTTRENLWLACSRCNDFKGDRIDGVDPETAQRIPFFNPRTQSWNEHFCWSPNGLRIEVLSPTGHVTIESLRLNNDFILVARQFWVESGRWPPLDDRG